MEGRPDSERAGSKRGLRSSNVEDAARAAKEVSREGEMKKQESDQGAPPAQSKLIIDRARWVRGNCDKSALLRSDGKMCCLGFFGRACGLPPDAILEKPSPDAVDGYTDHWPSWLLQYVDERGYHRDTAECSALIVTNDSSILTEPDREREIAALFAKHGVTVEFTGDAAEPPNE